MMATQLQKGEEKVGAEKPCSLGSALGVGAGIGSGKEVAATSHE